MPERRNLVLEEFSRSLLIAIQGWILPKMEANSWRTALSETAFDNGCDYLAKIIKTLLQKAVEIRPRAESLSVLLVGVS